MTLMHTFVQPAMATFEPDGSLPVVPPQRTLPPVAGGAVALLVDRAFPLLDAGLAFPPVAERLRPLLARRGGLSGLKQHLTALAKGETSAERKDFLAELSNLKDALEGLWQRRLYPLPGAFWSVDLQPGSSACSLAILTTPARLQVVAELEALRSTNPQMPYEICGLWRSRDRKCAVAKVMLDDRPAFRDLLSNSLIEIPNGRAGNDSTAAVARFGSAAFI